MGVRVHMQKWVQDSSHLNLCEHLSLHLITHTDTHMDTHTLVAWAQERAHQNRPYSRTSLLTAGAAMRTYLAGWMKVPL